MSEVSNEHAGDGVDTELTPYVENDGHRNVPHSLGLNPKHLLDLLQLPHCHVVTILRQSINKKKRVFEISGRREFKKKGVYAFRFEVSFLITSMMFVYV